MHLSAHALRTTRPATHLLPVLVAFLVSILILVFAAVPALADLRANIEWDDYERRVHDIPETGEEIAIDARLDEAVWAEAMEVVLTYEIDPMENVAPPVETKALFVHDAGTLYVAFEALDPEPSRIRAVLADRDSAWDDDRVGVMLDTFDDGRSAYGFFVNPLGVQMDLTRDDLSGGREDVAWNGIWDSAGRITETGYVVEMAIPFRSMRFQGAAGEQTWGVAAFRNYPRTVRHQISSFPLDPDRSCFLCLAHRMRGFDGITPGRNLEINPTFTAGRSDERVGSSVEEGDIENDLGLTASWGITPNVNLAATVNPDFSQVEADVAQLDVNNTFALFFPERRPFFLEGADLFRTPLQAVFTRNVADPDWGVKGTGKIGRGVFGTFVAEDEVTNLLIPGSQSSRTAVLDRPTTDAVARYRQDLGETSALGVLYTGRDGSGYKNHVAGIDGRFQFQDSHVVQFQALSSSTRYPGTVVDEMDQPSGTFDDQAYLLRYNYDVRDWGAWARYERRGEDFRADMGFVPRVGFDQAVLGARRNWIGTTDTWYTRAAAGGDWDITEDADGNVLEEEWEVWGEIGGPLQSFLWTGVGTRDQYFGGRTFDGNTFWNFYTAIRPSGAVRLELEGGLAETIDFTHVRPADSQRLEPRVSLKLGRRTDLRASHSFQSLDVDEGELFAAGLSELRGVYQINLRTFVRATFQYTDIDRNVALYDDEVASESERLFSELLFSYKLNPRTVLFVGYSDERLGDVEESLTQEGRSLFLKVGYAWET